MFAKLIILCIILWLVIFLHIATVVSFSQPAYSVDESLTLVQSMLTLTNPSSTDLTVDVLTTDLSALGKY